MDREEAVKRAKELVGQMTLEEKASQLRYDAPAIRRLGIPAYNWWNETLHGVGRAGVATVFPQAIGMAATFDPDLIGEAAKICAVEGRAKYNEYSKHGDRDIYKGLTYWTPNVNIFRDPRWGRGHETYGEDPYLTSRMGVSFVKGLQGDGKYMMAAACAKHFAVHSGPEALRHEFNAKVSKKDLNETYLPAFEACVKEGNVEAVMGAYNRVNGEPCCGSPTLIKHILRDKWKFKGHFVSDCWAIRDFHENHMVTSTAAESAALALSSGCDLNCGNTYLHILSAYNQKLVKEEQITQAAERLFTTRYLLGLFDHTEYDDISYDTVDCKSHKEKALEISKKAMVLLKNDGILPLSKDKINTIGVIGPNANSRKALIGNYHGTASEYVTMLEGIQREVGNDVRVLYSEGCHLYMDKVESLAMDQDRVTEAMIVAEKSDVVIVCLGLDETLEGEEGDTGNSYASGDKVDLHLPKTQEHLLEEIAKLNKPTILCLMAGSAIDLRMADKELNAILMAWYPGAQGGTAIADILFGKESPSGKLPITFYHDTESLPPFEDYNMEGRTYRYMKEPALYPFGYGLTYTEMDLEDVSVIVQEDGHPRVEAQIHNAGETDSDEVLQVYCKALDTKDEVPNWRLCGFRRVHVKAGEVHVTDIDLSKDVFATVNEEGEKTITGHDYLFYVGFSQPDVRSVELMGKEPLQVEVEI